MSFSLTRVANTDIFWTNQNGGSVEKLKDDIVIAGDVTPTKDIQLNRISWIISDEDDYKDVKIYVFDTTNEYIVAKGILTRESKPIQLHDSSYWSTKFSAIPLYANKTYRIAASVDENVSISSAVTPASLPTELEGVIIIGNGYTGDAAEVAGAPKMPKTSIGADWRGDFYIEFRVPLPETAETPAEPLIESSSGMFNIQLPEEWLPTLWSEWELQYQTALDNTVFDEWKNLDTIQYPDTLYTYSDLDVNDKPFYRFRYRLHTASNRTEWSEAATAGLAIDLLENIGGQVGGDQIEDNAIGTSHIQVDSITSTLIAANSITTSHLQAGSIVASKIAAATITANEIAALTITGDKIAANTITAGNIVAGTITATQIATGTITATQIKAGTITSAEIKTGTIIAGNIQAATITSTEIAASTITASNIAANTITATQLAANTITAAKIAAGTITTTEIAANTIEAVDIKAATITTTEIAASTIKGTNIAANTITAANITAGTITSTEIASATITGSNIAGSTITASNMTITTLSSLTADIGTITAGQLRIGTSGGTKVAIGQAISTSGGAKDGIIGTNSSNNITFFVDASTGNLQIKGQILSGSTGLGNISGTIDGKTNIASGTITGDRLVANTITAAQIAATTITATEIATGTITSTQIAASTIATTNLAANAVTTAKLAATAIDGMVITGTTLQTATSGSRVVLDSTGLRAFNSTTETLRIASTDGSSSIIIPEVGTTATAPQPANPSAAINTSGWHALSGGTVARTTTVGQFDSSPAGFKFMPLIGVDYMATLDDLTAWTNANPGFVAGHKYILKFKMRATSVDAVEVYFGKEATVSVSGLDDASDQGSAVFFLDTTFRWCEVEWVPVVTYANVGLNDKIQYCQVKIGSTIGQGDAFYVDSFSISEFVAPAERQLLLKDAVAGNKRGSFYGYRQTSENNSKVVVEATPDSASTSASSAALSVISSTEKARIEVYDNPSAMLYKRKAQVSILADSGNATIGATLLNSAEQSSFLKLSSVRDQTDFGIVASLPLSAIKGDTCIYKVAASSYWQLVYTGTNWAKIGGAALYDEGDNTVDRFLTNQTTYASLATDPLSISVPLAGDYQITIEGQIGSQTAGIVRLSFAVGATAASNNWGATVVNPSATTTAASVVKTSFFTSVAAGAVIAEKAKTDGNYTGQFGRRRLIVDAVRVV